MDMSSLTSLPQVLGPIYTSSRLYGTPNGPESSAVLGCVLCPTWEVDIDGTDLPTVVERALDHVQAEAHDWPRG